MRYAHYIQQQYTQDTLDWYKQNCNMEGKILKVKETHIPNLDKIAYT